MLRPSELRLRAWAVPVPALLPVSQGASMGLDIIRKPGAGSGSERLSWPAL